MAMAFGPVQELEALVGEPYLAPGRHGPWHRVRESMAHRGVAVVYGRRDDWLPADLDAPELRPLLGRDWIRQRTLGHPEARARFVASRLLLKTTAAAVFDCPPHLLDVAYRLGGRPYLRGCEQLDISLSHTERLMLVGLSRRGVIGVDAEVATRRMYGTGVELYACTAEERAALESLPAELRNDALVRLWTLKEAYSKAIGAGLRLRFTRFGFALDGPPGTLPRPPGAAGAAGAADAAGPPGPPGGAPPGHQPAGGAHWSFGSGLVDGRYLASVALGDLGEGRTGLPTGVELASAPLPFEAVAGA
ncbi:4'-phosphopantetheinyl transferase superfamily protein [Kitasatospora sp. NBC_01287]|uniref:4'-phosphopantetheinyl transferase family protein n=1 Tax=Kitasatospora sp. NBC_01287 TaxID=2903573 RepID=UPI0022511EAB|nr:4'-phosphopantetheinyl transferase superfamily protein [Kitasatospora sp. NBC_01287]MCX4748892.1 4'-phosphopantetheinyl transferase superfamily protein [Kitasatospora sp. NBC_01287]